MTKEQLAKLGIVIEEETIDDEKALELISKKQSEKDAELKKQKDLLSTRNSEIAEFKRKEQEKLTEEEKAKLHQTELENKVKSYERQIALNNKITEYISLGYDTDLAKKVAEAELDGKSTLEYRKQFIQAQQEKLKAEILKNGDDPHTNNGDDTKFTKENFKKGVISMEEMNKLKETNPNLYNDIIKG